MIKSTAITAADPTLTSSQDSPDPGFFSKFASVAQALLVASRDRHGLGRRPQIRPRGLPRVGASPKGSRRKTEESSKFIVIVPRREKQIWQAVKENMASLSR